MQLNHLIFRKQHPFQIWSSRSTVLQDLDASLFQPSRIKSTAAVKFVKDLVTGCLFNSAELEQGCIYTAKTVHLTN